MFEGYEEYSGRPIYEIDGNPENQNQKISVPSFWLNATLRKWIKIKRTDVSFTLELTNILNTKNPLIINPVTGNAYSDGDPVPSESRDPKYLDPRDYRSYGTPPNNPARYDSPFHFVFGIAIKFR